MVMIKRMTGEDFLKGRCVPLPEIGRHTYRAEWVLGLGMVVRDESGAPVDVTFSSTEDMRTVYAYIEGVGFIGGWQYPHKRTPFPKLVDYINRGILYSSMSMLPKKSTE